jgi:sulfite reductase (NADPH) hemoprotein beta-component
MGSISTAGEAVARIAYLSSDVIVSVQPSLATDSEFSEFLRASQKNKAQSVVAKQQPEIVSVRQNADPLLSVFQPIRAGKLTSVTTTSSILVKSIPHLYKLAQYPVVIHVSVHPTGFPDFSDITSIRQSGFTFLQSENLQESQDIALTAHALAIKSGKGVIHFFDSGAIAMDKKIPYENQELVRSVLDLDAVAAFQNSKSE